MLISQSRIATLLTIEYQRKNILHFESVPRIIHKGRNHVKQEFILAQSLTTTCKFAIQNCKKKIIYWIYFKNIKKIEPLSYPYAITSSETFIFV